MYHISNRRIYTREQIIKKLQLSDKNFIATYWSGVTQSDGCFTAGCSLVMHDPYYAGWSSCCEEQSEYITYAELELVKDVCDERPWGASFGGKCLGGVEYRLKPELRIAA